MSDFKTIDICDELKQNFIDFAYEANSRRGFPDARDGLKPGQRACLWEMYIKGYTSNKPHVKSAKIDGGVAATWWPHGTTAIYETFARMSQDWINNIPEVDWHGSNGNIVVGSAPAADRYTEARLNKAIEDGMFNNIKKDVVPMILNFSEDEKWPEVLPAIFPRLMVNGSQGIGVAVAQTWLPSSLTELHNVIVKYIQTGELDYSNLAPDFPSGGIIINKNEIPNIYATGKGRVVLRGKVDINKNIISITELPYQVYVEALITEIKECIDKGIISGIEDIYNKTDKKRLLIEIECNGNPSTVLSKLYSNTSLQKSYNANQVALVGKTPVLLNLKNYLDVYIRHNINCIIKECEFDIKKAQKELEIANGLLKALENIDNIIALIKKSESSSNAKDNLMKVYSFTENQAKAIVDMKLGRLAHLEYVKLNEEKNSLLSIIEKCNNILSNPNTQKDEFLHRLSDFVKKYGFARRTQITQIEAASKEEKEIEFVEPEQCVVVMTKNGYIKRVPSSSFKVQKRNGKGIKTQDDVAHSTIRTNTIDSLMVFTTKGKMYRLLVNDIPEGTSSAKGQPIKTLISMESDEEPSVIYSIYRDTDAKYVLFVTKNGIAKKTTLDEYIKTKKKTGLSAISIREDDELVCVTLVKDEPLIILTANGMGIKVDSKEIGATSRVTQGVKGITLAKDDKVVCALPIRDNNDCLSIFTQNGLGKKIKLDELPIQKRAGKGLMCYKLSNSTGLVVAGQLISNEDNIVIVGETNQICISAKEIPLLSRAGIGNQIIKNCKILSVSKI